MHVAGNSVVHARSLASLGAAWVSLGLIGCGDDTVVLAPVDAGAGVLDRTVPSFEAAVPTESSGQASILPRLLLSYNGTTSDGATKSELVAFGMASQQVDGRTTYDYSIGTAYVESAAPWLLEQEPNVGHEGSEAVARLDPLQPWVIAASWKVAMGDLTDAGYAQDYADPRAVISAGTKAYVLRYTRNLVGIIDTTQVTMGASPIGSVDLSSEVQTGGDGYVEPVAGVYVAAAKRVYVLLANVNRFNLTENTHVLVCASTTPTVVAIDTTSDALVDLNGAAAGHGWSLTGYAPLGAGSLAYDAHTGPSGRLLVLADGCNQSASDGGVGPLVKRQVEALDLSTGQATTLLDLTTAALPRSLTYVDGRHAILQMDAAYAWDPTIPMLGPAIPNAPDSFVYDGVANLVGVKANYAADGGLEGYDVVSVDVVSGVLATLGTNPFSLTGGSPAGVVLWPVP
jgi:hypothetical protein